MIRHFGPVVRRVTANEVLASPAPGGEIEGLTYANLGVIFINAMKEQQAQLAEQQKELQEQRARLQRQQEQIDALTESVTKTRREDQ